MIDDDFIAGFKQSDRKNLQLEMLRRLLSTEIALISTRNIVASKQFSEMLSDSLLRYQNRTLDSAVIELSDDIPKAIAHELVEIVHRDAKTDWAVKEQVRAKLRATIKRLLRKYGYPPDQAEDATALVLGQAEVIAAG